VHAAHAVPSRPARLKNQSSLWSAVAAAARGHTELSAAWRLPTPERRNRHVGAASLAWLGRRRRCQREPQVARNPESRCLGPTTRSHTSTGRDQVSRFDFDLTATLVPRPGSKKHCSEPPTYTPYTSSPQPPHTPLHKTHPHALSALPRALPRIPPARVCQGAKGTFAGAGPRGSSDQASGMSSEPKPGAHSARASVSITAEVRRAPGNVARAALASRGSPRPPQAPRARQPARGPCGPQHLRKREKRLCARLWQAR
jgi:hypothetical protein